MSKFLKNYKDLKWLQALLCAVVTLIVGDDSFASSTNALPATPAFNLAGEIPDQKENVVASGALLQKLAGGFAFTEGATCDARGNVFFVDQPNNSIMKWSADGKLSTFLHPSGHANGMCFDAKGNLIVCADEKNELWSVAPNKKVTVLVTNYQGKYLNGPNDVWITPNGAMFITDPFYKRAWWDHDKMPQDSEQVYYLSPDCREFRRLTSDLGEPNGIAGTPDGKHLYVADFHFKRTYHYDILPDGSLTNKTVFCGMGSDGMTMDEEGNIYLTGHGITVFDRFGTQIEHIDVPENWVGNLCFGGLDRRTLFITASTSLYSIHMRVRGASPAK
jgi:gluconolactonase